MIEIAFLGSGSSGNCAVVRAGGSVVLVDAGLSLRETKKRLATLGLTLEDVSAVLLTHEHHDHSRTAVDFAVKARLRVYATAGTERAIPFPGPLFADVRTVKAGRELRVGDLTIQPVTTPHDGVESVCYVLAAPNGQRCAVATDLGHLSGAVRRALHDVEVLGLEVNHDERMLRQGPYPYYLKQRILGDRGHLSNEAAAQGLLDLIGPRTRVVAALHVSRSNNTFALAGRAVGGALREAGVALHAEVARHDVATAWLSPSTQAPRADSTWEVPETDLPESDHR